MRHPLPPLSLSLVLAVMLSSLVGCGSEDEAPCRLLGNDDGTYTMRCPDGTSGVLYPAPEGQASGAVEGVAKRLGVEDGAGIVVELVPNRPDGPRHRTFTDVDGAYRFTEVEPGIYRLSFSYPAYVVRSVEQIPVLPGTLRPEPVVLRASKRILSKPVSSLIPSPRGDAILLHEAPAAPLHLWEEVGQETIRLGQVASSPTWLPSGRSVLFLGGGEFGEGGSLIRYDLGAARTTLVATRVLNWAVSEDERAVVAMQAQGRLSVWHDGNRSVVSGSGLVGWSFHPRSKQLVAFERMRGSSRVQVILWDVDAGTGSVLATAGGLDVSFDERGRSLLFRTDGGLAVWDAPRLRLVRLPSEFTEGKLSPDGKKVLLRQGNLRLVLHDIERGTTDHLVHGFLQWWEFDPRTSLPMFSYHHGFHREVAAFREGALVSLVPPGEEFVETYPPHFPPDSNVVIYSAANPPASGLGVSLVAWEPGQSARTVASGLDGPPEEVAGGSKLLLEGGQGISSYDPATGIVEEVATNGTLWPHYGSHADGTVFLPLQPFYRNAPALGQLVAPMCIYDVHSGETHVIVDEVWLQSCGFSAAGALLCLSRRSPLPPHGSELLYWDGERSALRRLADGVLAVHPMASGERVAFSTQPTRDTLGPLLHLYDPVADVSTPIDDEVARAVGNERWIVYSIESGDRSGVYVSTYPAPPREGGQSEAP